MISTCLKVVVEQRKRATTAKAAQLPKRSKALNLRRLSSSKDLRLEDTEEQQLQNQIHQTKQALKKDFSRISKLDRKEAVSWIAKVTAAWLSEEQNLFTREG